jgi:kynurenine formamidase
MNFTKSWSDSRSNLSVLIVEVHYTARFKASGDASIVWEGHKAGRERAYSQVEKLHNLEALPSKGFTVAMFPVNVKGASAGWTRAVAMM